jgi:3-oxoacyl-[acyl-carrier protein] reductase
LTFVFFKNSFMKLLEGKVAIITGASRGIGSGIAKVFAEHGANVAFTYSSSVESALVLEHELTVLGIKAKGYKSNAADFKEAQQLIDDVLAEFGTIDILINNAGITKDNLLMRMSEEDFDKVIEINLKSVFNMTKAVQKTMLKNRKGSIINMSSVVGVKGNAGQANYAASKAGMIGFTKSVALELGSRNIRCNAIAPGFIETEMTAKLNEDVVQGWRDSIPLRRGGTPEDVANACLFLASDLSAYVTGQVINVDGGMLT